MECIFYKSHYHFVIMPLFKHGVYSRDVALTHVQPMLYALQNKKLRSFQKMARIMHNPLGVSNFLVPYVLHSEPCNREYLKVLRFGLTKVLHEAVKYSCQNCVSYLVDKGANVMSLAQDGKLPSEWASKPEIRSYFKGRTSSQVQRLSIICR